MEWFIHYSNASDDNKLGNVFDELGASGIGYWWMLLEVCASLWDGKREPIFKINRNRLQRIFKTHPKKLEKILKCFVKYSLISCDNVSTMSEQCRNNVATMSEQCRNNVETNLQLSIPNLLKIKNKISQNKVKKSKVKENKRKENNFDFDKLYEMYPRKEGKGQGLLKCEAQIKDLKGYEKLKTAIRNYAKAKEGTEKKYVLMFSTFMNKTWEDWINPDETAMTGKRSLKGRDEPSPEVKELLAHASR